MLGRNVWTRSFLGLFSLCSVAASANNAGEGSFAIYCQNEYPQLMGRRSLPVNFFLGYAGHNWAPSLGTGNTVEDKVMLAIARLERRDSQRATQFRSWAERFFDEAQIDTPISFPSVTRPAISLPGSDCRVEHVSHQNRDPIFGESRYLIERTLWDVLDDDSRAGIVLLEIVNRSLAFNAFGRASYFSAFVSSDAIARMTQSEYDAYIFDTFQLSRENRFVHHGWEFVHDSRAYDRDGNLHSAEDVEGNYFEFHPNGNFKSLEVNQEDLHLRRYQGGVFMFPVETSKGRRYGPARSSEQNCTISYVVRAKFDETGVLRDAEFSADDEDGYASLCHRETKEYLGQLTFSIMDGFDFYPGGGFHSAVPSPNEPSDQHISMLGLWLSSRVGERMTFHDNGIPHVAYPTNQILDLHGRGSLIFLSDRGTLVTVVRGQLVQFNRQAQLVRW